MERRTYKETYFWMIILCVIITIGSDHYDISVDQMTTYAEDFIKRALKNMNSLIIWIVPIVILVKKELTAWRTALYAKDIALANIKNSSKDTTQCEK